MSKQAGHTRIENHRTRQFGMQCSSAPPPFWGSCWGGRGLGRAGTQPASRTEPRRTTSCRGGRAVTGHVGGRWIAGVRCRREVRGSDLRRRASNPQCPCRPHSHIHRRAIVLPARQHLQVTGMAPEALLELQQLAAGSPQPTCTLCWCVVGGSPLGSGTAAASIPHLGRHVRGRAANRVRPAVQDRVLRVCNRENGRCNELQACGSHDLAAWKAAPEQHPQHRARSQRSCRPAQPISAAYVLVEPPKAPTLE